MIPNEEIKIERFRRSCDTLGEGDNGIRATHIPTGKYVDEGASRFYHANYHRAIERLNELVFPGKQLEAIKNHMDMDFQKWMTDQGFANIGGIWVRPVIQLTAEELAAKINQWSRLTIVE